MIKAGLYFHIGESADKCAEQEGDRMVVCDKARARKPSLLTERLLKHPRNLDDTHFS
jgi:hypothetical protein